MEKLLKINYKKQDMWGVFHYSNTPNQHTVIMPPAGLKYRVGPHRLYVKLSRHLAKAGINSFRFDFPGIGDSEGDFNSDSVFYLWYQFQHGYFIDSFRFILSNVKKTENIGDVALFGLCGGAITSLLTAVDQHDVKFLIIMGLPADVEGAPLDVEMNKSGSRSILNRMKSKEEWKKLFSAIREPKVLIQSLGILLKNGNVIRNNKIPINSNITYHELLLDHLEKYIISGRKLFFIYGEKDVYYQEFKRLIQPWLLKKNYSDRVSLLVLKNSNHSATQPECQEILYKEVISFIKNSDQHINNHMVVDTTQNVESEMNQKEDMIMAHVSENKTYSGEKIRIAHVLSYLTMSGTELGVVKQSTALIKGPFDMTIIYFSGHQEEALAKVPSEVNLIKLTRRSGFDWRLVWQLAKILRENKFDIIHSHNWATMLYSILAARLAGVAVSIHGEHGREAEHNEFKTKRRIVNRLLLPLYDMMTTVSDDIASDWQKLNILFPWQIVSIKNGVDLTRFQLDYDQKQNRRELKLPLNSIIIGTVVGFLRPVKNIENLMSAFAEVKRNRNDVHLAIVGYGDYTEKLREKAHALGITNATTFLGMQKDIPKVIGAFDIYVNSSIYEGMSNTILEAMAMAKPVVATAVGGTPYIIDNKVNGLLVPTKSPQELANALGLLLNDEKCRNQLGQNARKGIENKHDLFQTMNHYAYLYSRSFSDNRKKNSNIKTLAKKSLLNTLSVTLKVSKAHIANGLHVIGSHQVVPFEKWHTLLQPQQSIPLETFEKQVGYLSENAKAVGLEEIADRMKSSHGFDEPVFTITFDDGFQDIYSYAFPVLKKYNVPFFVFLVGDTISSGKDIWWCDVIKRLHALFHQHPESWRELNEEYEWLFIQNGSFEKRDVFQMIREIVRVLNLNDEKLRETFCNRLHKLSEDLSLSNDMKVMSKEETRTLLDSGLVTLGAHSMRHLYMDTLDDKTLYHEVNSSKGIIEQTFDCSVKTFAYPWGRQNSKCQSMLKDSGYDLAFSTFNGINKKNVNPYVIHRRDASYLSENLVFSHRRTRLELMGWLDFLQR